jgi:hypothetical protein
MATTNLDSADLKAVLAGGWVHEDLMNKIWDISNVPLPLTNMIGTGTATNEYSEWSTDELAAPNLANKVVDGADQNTINNTKTGARLGNHSQISTKVVQVSSRADSSDTVGATRELSYQISQRQKELRRDVEANALSGHGSIADDGATIAGQSAGVPAFMNTNNSMGATGAIAGFQTGTKLISAVTQGTKRGLTETMVRDMIQAIYMKGGDPSIFMSAPGVIRKFSEYCFGTTAKVATLMADIGQNDAPATAKGAVNVFVTDFGTVSLIPNRLQQDVAASVANALILDPPTIELAFLRGYQTEPLAKTGLSEIRLMSVDWMVRVLSDDANGVIGDIDYTVAVAP